MFVEAGADGTVTRALNQAKIHFLLVELRGRPDGATLLHALQTTTGLNVPLFVFALGEFVGAPDAVLAKLDRGEFENLLRHPFGTVTVSLKPLSPPAVSGEAFVLATSAPVSSLPKYAWRPLFTQWPLFWFPYAVDSVSGRSTSLLAALVSIVCAVFAETRWCRVLIAAMFTDSVFRFLFGDRSSFVGAIGDLVAQFLPLKLEASPSRQVRARVYCFVRLYTFLARVFSEQMFNLVTAGLTGGSTLAVYLSVNDSDGELAARVLMAVASLVFVLVRCWIAVRFRALSMTFGCVQDAAFNVSVGAAVYKALEVVGIISAGNVKKCEGMLADHTNSEMFVRTRMNVPPKKCVTLAASPRAFLMWCCAGGLSGFLTVSYHSHTSRKVTVNAKKTSAS